MAVVSDGSENLDVPTHELILPAEFTPDSSNLCIKDLGKKRVIVGNEEGFYVASIDSLPGSRECVQNFKSKEVPSVCVEPDSEDIFYVATGTSIFKFDYRCPLDKELCSFTDNTEEVNYLTLNIKGHLASCDDSGECKIYDTRKNSVYRTLRNRHKNICSSAVFLPTRPDEIVTGGLDSQILVWNHSTVRFVQGINTQNLLQNLGDNSVNMFNPPLVNALNCSNDGKLLVSGLGKISDS